jgi:hypothetical protein
MAHTDRVGQTYSTPDNTPAGNGTTVTVYGPNGSSQGTMVGGIVQPNT